MVRIPVSSFFQPSDTCNRSHLFAVSCSLLVLFLILIPLTSPAFEDSLEKDIQTSLEQSRAITLTIQHKLQTGASVSSEISKLKAAADDVRISNLLLEERFKLREEKVKTLGSTALARHQAMVADYRAALTEYLSIVDGLPSDGTISQSAIQNLQSLLDKLLPKRHRPIIGSLPYKHLNYPAQEPSTAPEITPAYRGGNKIVSAADTRSTETAPISKTIAEFAQSFNWQPVAEYEYVKNEISTEWYWGCQKGAEETLRQKSGNDCDQSLLLASLLKASGFPTRIVRGNIQFFASDGKPIERVKNLTGIDDPWKIAEFFQKSGIPYKPIIAGGKIVNFEISHIYVESQIPYANYRGIVIDEHGRTWLGLDSAIKVKDYVYNNPKDVYQESAVGSLLSAVRDEYLGIITSTTGSSSYELNQTPLEYLQSRINSELATRNAQLTYSDFLQSRTLPEEHLNILPESTQFKLIKATNEYTEVPDELIHKAKFTATDANNNQLFTITLPTYKLSNQQVTLSYEPETVEDQEIIDSYGGLDNTPSYLVRLRSVLKLNGERIIIATDGLPMGSDYNLTIELYSPSVNEGATPAETITNAMITGNLSVIGITAGKAVQSSESTAQSEKNAERLLYESAQHYIDRWNQAEDELASLLHLSIARPLPTVVTLGGMIDVTYLLDMPHGFTWKGVYVDADHRSIETVTRTQSTDDRQKLFMQLSSLQGSIIESRIFEDDFKVEAISTAKLFQIVNSQPVGPQLVTVDKSNIAAVLPTLTVDDNIKEDITNAVNQNFIIRIPQSSETTYHDWAGTGYVKEKNDTGESGWMLSGMVAGGMTAIKKEQWINQDIATILNQPNTLPPNSNPGAAVRLVRMSDYQTGFAGNTLTVPCQARAEDASGRPVTNVPVTFRIIAGGGKVQGVDNLGNVLPNQADNSTAPATAYIVKTGPDGIARAKVTLGEKVDDSPYYRQELSIDNRQYWELVGQNMVSMSGQTSGAGTLFTDKPFEAYGRAGKAAKIEVVSPKTTFYGLPNTLASSAWVKVVDQYGNSISGKNMNFFIERTFLGQDPGPDAKTARLYPAQAACPGIPTLDCPNAAEYTASNPLVVPAEHYGAMAYVIIGNTANTRFTVKATAKQDAFNTSGKRIDTETPLPTAEMVYQTNAKTGTAPEFAMTALAVYQYDEQGNRTNAGKAGSLFPEKLTAALFYHQEGYEPAVDASGNYYLKGTGVFTTSKVNNGQVKFTVSQGGGSVSPEIQTAATDGQYLVSLTLGTVPGLNIIQAAGSASLPVPTIDSTTGTVNTPNTALQAQTTFNVWGVKPTVEPNQLVLINSDGFPVNDTEIQFTIDPATYPYSTKSLYLDFYEKNTLGNESWMGFVQAEPSGKIILTQGGTKFNPAYTYSVQLIVDRGTKKEVVSEKASLPVAQLAVLTDEYPEKTADEIKFGTGADLYEWQKKKIYHLNMQSAALINNCASLTGKISIINQSGQPVTLPSGDGQAYTAEYQLKGDSTLTGCRLQISDTLANKTQNKFIVSNRSRAALNEGWLNYNVSDKAVLYGGIGNHVKVEVNQSQKYVPIEPVGVIVLGIDGLRQDVLYKSEEQQVNPAGTLSPYYVEPAQLKGLCDVLGGKISGVFSTSCDPTGYENKHVKLPNVTAIFPSITFASWASIFTGMTPSQTGILGNEFFARDLIMNNSGTYGWARIIPGLEGFPPGVVTLDGDGGAFYPGGGKFALSHAIPAEFSVLGLGTGATTMNDKLQASSPNASLNTEPLWSSINNIVDAKYAISLKDGNGATTTRCDQSAYECGTVSIFNQYARGADWWGTAGSFWSNAFTYVLNKDAVVLDKSATGEATNFITNYFAQNTSDGKRKKFPAVFSVYLAGLDHDAHLAGMGNYINFFKTSTDPRVADIVKALKDQGEFDNKIFVIVADHGHTAMPTGMTYIHEAPIYDPESGEFIGINQTQRQAEMSCSLKTNFAVNSANDYEGKNARNAELENNNLHIWELGEVFKAIGENGWGQYKVLAPKEIAKLYRKTDKVTNQTVEMPYGATAQVEKADIIVGLNGPMAHVYLTDMNKLGKIAELFRLTLDDHPAEAAQWWNIDDLDYSDFKINTVGRLKTSVDKILVRVADDYCVFDGLNDDGSVRCASTDSLSVPAYVDAWTRINGMNNKDRSGDIVLIMRDATLGNAVDRYTTGVACKSWHGSLSPSDSYVPFIASYPGGNKSELEKILQKDSLCKTDYSDCKGNWKLSDIVKEIISEQYK